jgi:hypothetical protein
LLICFTSSTACGMDGTSGALLDASPRSTTQRTAHPKTT